MEYIDVLKDILKLQTARYIVVETKYTEHHIEVLMRSCQDRGRYKWIAETKIEAWENVDKDDEARRSHIDNCDLFPRLYFRDLSLCNEIADWLQVRGLAITDIRTPKV